MKKNKTTQVGFTLVEVMMYVMFLGMLVVVILSLFLWANRTQIKATVIKEVVSNTNLAISVMTHEIKQAQSVYLPTSTATQLSLATTNNLPAGENLVYIDFYLCGTQVCVKREGQDEAALTADTVAVTNLDFEQIATSSVASIRINLGLESANLSSRPEYSFSYNISSVASLRSY